MRKTLITGATGELGSAVAEFLSTKIDKSNIAVLVRDVHSEKAEQYKQQGLDIRIGDYDNKDSLLNAFSGIEQLYFISGNDVMARLKQHENVVKAAKEAGVKHILYTSTVRKDESPEAPLYAVVSGHLKTEELIKESGITYTILRHSLYAEVIPMFIGDRSKLLETKSIYLPVGSGKTAFVARRDFAEAGAVILADAKAHENKVYKFLGSEKINFEEVSQTISEVTGEQIGFTSPSVEEFEATLKSIGLPQEIIAMLSMFSQAIANGEFDQEASDLETILGRKTLGLKTFLSNVYSK